MLWHNHNSLENTSNPIFSQQRHRWQQGFTLVEVLVTTGIVSTVMIMLLRLFVYCTSLSEMAGNLSASVVQAQDKIEEIKNYSYDLITTDYSSSGTPGNTFSFSIPTGMGVIYIDSSNSSLLQVEVDVSWRNRDGRIVGEDTDLDGVIDTGEDVNSNGKLDSVVKIITNLAQR